MNKLRMCMCVYVLKTQMGGEFNTDPEDINLSKKEQRKFKICHNFLYFYLLKPKHCRCVRHKKKVKPDEKQPAHSQKFN